MVMPTHEGPWMSVYLAMLAMMHPSCAVRTRWDVYILVVMLVLCLVTPYTIGFDITPKMYSVIGAASFHSVLPRNQLFGCFSDGSVGV